MSNTLTRGIRVQVRSEYLEQESHPDRNYFFFAYHIRISNEGSEIVQLINRHWIITDANGEQKEVRGPGVVGYQPVLRPGEFFDYSSHCPLPTPVGSMTGSYQMIANDCEEFDARIASFTLAVPGSLQ